MFIVVRISEFALCDFFNNLNDFLILYKRFYTSVIHSLKMFPMHYVRVHI